VVLEACVDLACDVDMVSVARRFVERTLRLWEVDDTFVDEAVLLASELMSNAVLHARTDVRVTVLAHEDGSLRVEVADENSRLPLTAAPPEDAQSGRGLWLVETLASSWGVERTGEGKTIWFELGEFRATPDDPCLDLTTTESVDEALDQVEALVDPSSESDPATEP
jgi:anti-sigma regulatory factor (Ser/Thr protein kinase)